MSITIEIFFIITRESLRQVFKIKLILNLMINSKVLDLVPKIILITKIK
jgi:hypothetical protein